MVHRERLRCPVCRARFRGDITCSRCGAGLRRLMELAMQAFRLRERARSALDAGDLTSATRHIDRAQCCHATEIGSKLERLTRLLMKAN